MNEGLITGARIRKIRVPLKQPFQTHLQLVTTRETIILELFSTTETGLGECVAFSTPWYTEETVESAWEYLVNHLPTILAKPLLHPSEIMNELLKEKGNAMAKATIDHALWDLYAKKQRLSLSELIGGATSSIPAGTVVTWQNEQELQTKIDDAMNRGYKRIKVKITPQTNVALLQKIVKDNEHLSFFADANGAFSNEESHSSLLDFDSIGFTLIEQPFFKGEEEKSAEATRRMNTPIALDESIDSFEAVEKMIQHGWGNIVVLKQGRVGGLTTSLEIVKRCRACNIPVWIGGMIEFGISKSFNLALNTLADFQLTGDFTDSTHYWERDIINPPISVRDGRISLPDGFGIGRDLNEDVMKKYTVKTHVW
ncbi:o-succinylbenzoate synthase [Paenisporosarcina cavernae]|uniref:o-succinylbenzoate synthase n=1 Tax=Paenisporosarcina cavernae TaxID=2320858 RepID=A0A385YUE2_9BACL|nr:o-succinylbenzoate synthase [Paenisporosarcina cavernae]AYC29920.1 o-succinylbenzoate synthase [Paenisporosarcina cavernae]